VTVNVTPLPRPAAERPLLEIRNLSVDFHTSRGIVHAVQDVSLQVSRGETLAILGESGSGKSITVAAVMDLIDSPPGFIRSGEILLDNVDLRKINAAQRRDINGRRIAMIFQDPLAALNPVYPVGWQVAETLRVHGHGARRPQDVAVELLDRVGIPDAARRANDYPHQFSGGQRQRIMIAMAIATEPDLLIADEPTTALDVTVQAQILRLLKRLQAETGMGLILITHDLGVAAEMADRVAVMQGGSIVETGDVQSILTAPSHPYTQQLLESVPGRHGFPKAASHREAQVPLLEVRDLVVEYAGGGLLARGLFGSGKLQGLRAVDHVSLTLSRGESLGLVGESGSGKSTLARTLLGLSQATSGQVLYEGKDIATFSAVERTRFRRHIQVVFQDPTASLNPYMTVREIIAEPWAIHPGVAAREDWPRRVSELLEKVGLKPEHALRYPHQFSGGQRQRIAIARALALNPDVIVCDEAVSALDVSIQAQIMDLLKQLRRDFGLSFLFIAHDLPVVRDFADRLLVMRNGKIVESGATAEVFERPQHPYTRELLASSLLTRPADDPAEPIPFRSPTTSRKP
jgi:peptide/nickel transport system ATP-binding protein